MFSAFIHTAISRHIFPGTYWQGIYESKTDTDRRWDFLKAAKGVRHLSLTEVIYNIQSTKEAFSYV